MPTRTPNVSEFLNASNWEYDQVGTPADLRPFIVDGKQLSAFSEADGFSASAWVTPSGQVVVSYEGTQAVSVLAVATNPLFTFDQFLQDAGVASGTVTPSERDAAVFARAVVAAAARKGIASSDIFLTGHSLGGIQAEYAAQQTGLGGMAFESTGIPRSATTAGNGQNFVNVVTYGDAVANYASDIDAEQPFAPAYAPGGAGSLPHYGYVAMIGNPGDQASLKAAAQLSRLGPAGVALTAAAYVGNVAAFHIPSVQAHDLGVTLTQHPLGDAAGIKTAAVLPAAGDTIPQFISAASATLSAPLPPSPGVSPSTGPSSGQAAATFAGFGPAAAYLVPTAGGLLTSPQGAGSSAVSNSYGLATAPVDSYVAGPPHASGPSSQGLFGGPATTPGQLAAAWPFTPGVHSVV